MQHSNRKFHGLSSPCICLLVTKGATHMSPGEKSSRRRRPSRRHEALWCGPRHHPKGAFLGGARSPRPDCNALLMPRHFITLGGWPGGRSIMGTCLGQTGALLRACGARPSAGWTIRPRKALRGKPGDNIEVGFLGGTHSVRPRGTAERLPRHFFPTTCVEDCARAYRPHASVKPVPSSGRAEPAPPRGGPSKLGWPCRGEGPEMTRKAVFSEGRGLRARIARPN
jgi:hypothetical protein